MVESVPSGFFLGAEPGWAAANPPGDGAVAGQSRQGTWQSAARSRFCFGGRYSPAYYSLWF